MNVCEKCCVELRCIKNGVVVRVPSTGYCERGDIYACPQCGMRMVQSNGHGYFEDTVVCSDVYYDLGGS
jgi:uncharacterized protein with PIN domain